MTNTKNNKAMTLRIGKRIQNYNRTEMNIFVKILMFIPMVVAMTIFTAYEEIVYFFKECNMLQKAKKLLGLICCIACLYILISFFDCLIAQWEAPVGISWCNYTWKLNFFNLLVALF